MAETAFSGGGWQYTLALTPSAPVVTVDAADALIVAPGPDGNPSHTEYAIRHETSDAWLDAAGEDTLLPVWRTREGWGELRTAGLAPASTHSFRVKARNSEGVETAFGPLAEAVTCLRDEAVLALAVTVEKAAAMVSAPSFMRGLAPAVRLAGTDLHDFGFRVDRITGMDMPAVEGEEEFAPGGMAWLLRGGWFRPRRIIVEGHVHGESAADLQVRLACLKSFAAAVAGDPWRPARPVRLERDDLPGRHWRVAYDAMDLAEPVGAAVGSSSVRVRIAFKSALPFALSNEAVRVTLVPEAGRFTPLDLGNAPSDAAYVITGPAATPSFTVGDMVFLCDFSDGLAYSDVTGSAGAGTFDPPAGEAAAYRAAESGVGLLVSGEDTVSYAAPGNPADGAWVAVIAPQWRSSEAASDRVVLEHRADADNYLRLFWDAAGGRWVFRKCAGGTVVDAAGAPQAFEAGNRIVLGVSCDATNAGGMKLFVDGELAGVAADVAPLEMSPSALTLHGSDGTGQPDAVFELVAGWSRMLAGDEMRRIAVDPGAVANRNVTVTCALPLDAGDLLMLDTERATAVVFDVSAGESVNALDAVAGTIPPLVPGRRRTASDRTQTMLYTPFAAAGMEVRYRRAYL